MGTATTAAASSATAWLRSRADDSVANCGSFLMSKSRA
jgi:hypothetical protein